MAAASTGVPPGPPEPRGQYTHRSSPLHPAPPEPATARPLAWRRPCLTFRRTDVPTAKPRSRRTLTALASAFGIAAASIGLWAGFGAPSDAHAAATVPTPDHTVVVVFENHAYSQVIGSSSAPYINPLKSGGANLTASYAETHPSQPNYFALFSGGTQGITDDSCYTPGFSSAANLASEQ